MTVLETVFEELERAQLIESAEEYSLGWCGKSKSWYANRKHEGREFALDAAITCLDRATLKLSVLRWRSLKYGNLLQDEIETLDRVTLQLRTFLLDHHRVAQAQLTPAPDMTML